MVGNILYNYQQFWRFEPLLHRDRIEALIGQELGRNS